MLRAIEFNTLAVWVWRVSLLLSGLFVFSIGMVMNIRANLGLGPWNVFHYGLTVLTPLTFGQVTQSVGLCMIAISYVLGIKPGTATIANMIAVGLFIDLIMPWLPDMREPVSQYVTVLAGILIMGLGTATYIKAGFGAGPRDGFMLGLVRKSGWRVGVIRSLIEGTVLVLGYLMGGPVGVGTAVFVLGIGPAVDLFFVLFRVPVKRKGRAQRL